MLLFHGTCFLGRGDFQSSPNPLSCEHPTAEGNQVLVSWFRSSLYKSQGVSPFGPPADEHSASEASLGRGTGYIIPSLGVIVTLSPFQAPLSRIEPLSSGPAGYSHQKVNLEQTGFRTTGNSVCPEGIDYQ